MYVVCLGRVWCSMLIVDARCLHILIFLLCFFILFFILFSEKMLEHAYDSISNSERAHTLSCNVSFMIKKIQQLSQKIAQSKLQQCIHILNDTKRQKIQ